ncbi:chymotrypsin-like elastase family member 1 [Argopecten irradians]|uniref:chymotrypsin-like elastase family member 1 n=1 Tax=Argopecten irradians TaxID=31199 RepID=UPI00371CFF86
MDSRMVQLALALCGFVALVASEGEDGGSGPGGVPPSIVGGTTAAEDAWPWQVNILYRKRFICGGTILNENTILTAAHCTDLLQKRTLKVVIGDYDRRKNEKKTRGERKMAVKQIIQHPDYDGDVLHDFSIIKLKRKIKYGDFIQPIPSLADDSMNLMNSTCFVTGWGATKGPLSSARFLQELQTPVITNDACEAGIILNYPVTDDMICTDSEPKGSCYGDSGGPLQCLVDGKWVHAGAVSWGNENCRVGPSVYARTSYHRDWILSKM